MVPEAAGGVGDTASGSAGVAADGGSDDDGSTPMAFSGRAAPFTSENASLPELATSLRASPPT